MKRFMQFLLASFGILALTLTGCDHVDYEDDMMGEDGEMMEEEMEAEEAAPEEEAAEEAVEEEAAEEAAAEEATE